MGGRIAAPCPGNMVCPIEDPDWCHFAARVERTSLHRRLKEAELGYEDEKFSYVVLAKTEAEPARARIVSRPEQKPGLIVLETCTAEGLRTSGDEARPGSLPRRTAGQWDALDGSQPRMKPDGQCLAGLRERNSVGQDGLLDAAQPALGRVSNPTPGTNLPTCRIRFSAPVKLRARWWIRNSA